MLAQCRHTYMYLHAHTGVHINAYRLASVHACTSTWLHAYRPNTWTELARSVVTTKMIIYDDGNHGADVADVHDEGR